MPRTLLLCTQSYPWEVAVEHSFVEPELPYLARHFDRVVVVPESLAGNRTALPSGVELETGHAEDLAKITRLDRLRHALAGRWAGDLLEHPRLATSRAALVRMIGFAALAERSRRWLGRYLTGEALVYTFWCDSTTTAACLLKRERPGLRVVSRAHGYDLYPERHVPAFLPGRTATLRALDRMYPDSEQGARYVAGRWPWFAPRCRAALMGVPDPGFQAVASTDDTFRLVSCSRINAVKRVDLVLGAVAAAARLRPERRFRWDHFGDGAGRAALAEEAARALPANAEAHFPGYPSLADLMRAYATRPVDLFVNASRSEGTPVSVMEAASCGIPVVATAVGGNPEIVSAENGALVPADVTAEGLAAAMLAVLEDEPREARRQASRAVWARKYDAAKNYEDFARELAALV